MAKVCRLPDSAAPFRNEIAKDAKKYAENGMVKATEAHIKKLEAARDSVAKSIAAAFPTDYSNAQDLNAPRTNGIGAAAVQKVVDTITKNWTSPPAIRVVASEADFTQAERDGLDRDNARGAEGWYRDGEVTLLAYNIRSLPKAVATLYHESLGHHGLQGAFQQELKALTRSIYDGNAAARKHADDMVKAGTVNNIHVGVEEFLANKAQTNQKDATLLDRAQSLVTKFARQMGLTKRFSNAEIAEVLRTAASAVKTGKIGPVKSSKRYQRATALPTPPMEKARSAYEKFIAATIYGGRNAKGEIDATRVGQAGFQRSAIANAVSNAINATGAAVKKGFVPLNTMLDKSYWGRAVKKYFLMQGAMTTTYKNWLDTQYKTKILADVQDKKVADAIDPMMQMMSASASASMNNPETVAEVEKLIKDSGFESWIVDAGSDNARITQLMDQNPELFDKLFEIATRGVDFDNGTVDVDYWRENDESADERLARKETNKGKKGDAKKNKGFDTANAETYRVFDGLNAEQIAKVKRVTREYFNMNAKMQMARAASTSFAFQSSIDEAVRRNLTLPFGLDMATTEETLGEIHHTYMTLLMDQNTLQEAANFRNAVTTAIYKGSFNNTGKNASEAAKDYLPVLFGMHRSLSAKGSDIQAFKNNMEDVFNKELAISVERPVVTERLVSSIGGFYIPQQRQSPYKVRLVPTATDGKPISLDRNEYGRMVMSVESNLEAEAFKEFFEEQGLSKNKFKVVDSEGNLREITLRADTIVSNIEDTATTEAGASLRQMLSALTTAGINLDQRETERFIRAQAGRSTAALRSLRRTFAYGQDIDAQRLLAQNMNNISYQIADNVWGSKIDELLSNNMDWSVENLKTLEAQVAKSVKLLEASKDPAAKARLVAEKERLMNLQDAQKNHDDKQARETKNLVRSAREAAKREHVGEPGALDKLRKWTAVATLGASVSSFVTNILGGIPSTISYLGGKNDDTGFGGGYGYTRAAQAMTQAMATLTSATGLNIFKNDIGAEAINKYAQSSKVTGMEQRIWSTVAREMAEGRLQVGNGMSMTQLANEGATTRAQGLQRGVELIMRPFTASEAAIRVSTFVAAARLEADRQMKGRSFDEVVKNDAEFKLMMEKVAEAGNDAVENTQGVYDYWAKGQYMRDGVSGTLTMFKHYPAVQLTLLANMDNKSRAMYMAMLWMTAGLDGEPLADDAKELYNLLAGLFPKFFGGTFGSLDARKSVNSMYQAVEDGTGVPAHMLKHGLISYATGADFTGSMGMGSVLPLKGLTDKAAITDSFGPVASFVFNGVDSGGALMSAAGSALSGDTERASEKLFTAGKAAPVKMIRNLTGAFDMGEDGVSSTRNGLTVATGLDAFDASAKALGWRPLEEARGYEGADILKRGKDLRTSIQQDINNMFTIAAIEGNAELRRETVQHVKDVNTALAAGGAPFRVKYDPDVIRKLVEEGRKPIDERMLAKMPKDMQGFGKQTMEWE